MKNGKKEIAVRNGKSELQMIDFGNDNVQDLINSIVEGFTPGTDFGYPYEGAKKKEIYKPGVEKVCLRFNIEPRFERDQETVEMIGIPKVIAFKCVLIHRPTGQRVGEGRGVGLVGEKKMTINATVKMAEIRAQKDAILRTFSLSDRFSQDSEDIPESEAKEKNGTKIKIDSNGTVMEL